MEELNKLTRFTSTLVEFMQKSPLRGLKLDLVRDKSADREDIELLDTIIWNE